jgi:hypothetical protein
VTALVVNSNDLLPIGPKGYLLLTCFRSRLSGPKEFQRSPNVYGLALNRTNQRTIPPIVYFTTTSIPFPTFLS